VENHDVTVDALPQADNGDAVRHESVAIRIVRGGYGWSPAERTRRSSVDLARRFLAAVLIATLSFFAVACNGDDGGGDDVEAEEGEGEDE
jgi:hypothetical protein